MHTFTSIDDFFYFQCHGQSTDRQLRGMARSAQCQISPGSFLCPSSERTYHKHTHAAVTPALENGNHTSCHPYLRHCNPQLGLTARTLAQINVSEEILAQYIVNLCKPPRQKCAEKKFWCHIFNTGVAVKNVIGFVYFTLHVMESHYHRHFVVGCDKFISLDYCQCSAMFMWIDMLHSNYDLSEYHLKDMGYSTRFSSWTTASPLQLDGCDVQSKLHFSAVWGCAKVAGYTEGRCLVGGLINNAQTVNSPGTLVAGPSLILAMWTAARGDPGCLVSVPCVSLRWPGTQWSEPVP